MVNYVKNFPKNIKVTEEDYCGVHPSLSVFTPVFTKKNRGYSLQLFGGSYKSSKHNHSVENRILDLKRTGRGGKNIYILIEVVLNRYSHGVAFVNGAYYGYFLVGYDDGSAFVTRLPNKNFNTVDGALEWMKPAVVKKAEEKGKEIYRQGDVFFVEAPKRTSIFDKKHLLPHSHILHDDLTVTHGEHNILQLPHEHFTVAIRKALADND